MTKKRAKRQHMLTLKTLDIDFRLSTLEERYIEIREGQSKVNDDIRQVINRLSDLQKSIDRVSKESDILKFTIEWRCETCGWPEASQPILFYLGLPLKCSKCKSQQLPDYVDFLFNRHKSGPFRRLESLVDGADPDTTNLKR